MTWGPTWAKGKKSSRSQISLSRQQEAQSQACLDLLDLGTPLVLHWADHRVMLYNWGLGRGWAAVLPGDMA